MLFHASDENSEPTIAAPNAAARERPESSPAGPAPPAAPGSGAAANGSARLARATSRSAPTSTPIPITAARATVLLTVKAFWIRRPWRRPAALTAVSPAMLAMPRTCAALTSSGPSVARTFDVEKNGTSCAVNFANATPTAAIVPVWITRKKVQP